MSYFFYLFLFILGLGVGSFLNVVSLRFKPENQVFDPKKIGGRSACPYCQKILGWYELIPIVSFLVQAGKCRSCGHRLSWQYPVVELLSGLIFVTVPLFLSSNYQLLITNYSRIWFSLIWISVLLILLLISLIDLRHFFIPDELTWLLVVLGFAFIVFKSQTQSFTGLFNQSFLRHYALLLTWSDNIWLNHLFAAAIAIVFFGLLFFLGKGEILGGGDVKLAFALGLILGWPDIAIALFFAFLLGGLFGLILLISRKKTMKDYLPLAPFLVVGVTLTVFLGYQIINGYFLLIGF